MAIALRNKIVVTRKRFDVQFGEKTAPQLAQIAVARLLEEPQLIAADSGLRTTQAGWLWVARGADLRDGDIVVLPEGEFGVHGDAQLDQLHPMSGHDFGVVAFSIRRGG